MPYFSYLSPANAKFHKILQKTEIPWIFHKIPQKNRNFVETGKFRGLAQNSVFSGKPWSVMMNVFRDSHVPLL